MDSGDNGVNRGDSGGGLTRSNSNSLRRPMSETLEQITQLTHCMNINTNAAGDCPALGRAGTTKSQLNPNACEFVPKSFMACGAATSSSLQSNGRMMNGDSSSSMNDDHLNEYYNQYDRRDSEQFHDDFILLSELKDFIDLISSRPDQYDKCVDQVTDTMNRWTNDDEDLMLVYVVNTIVDQAIIDTNFRYNGVRFCMHLIENFTIETPKGNFETLLLQRCQREYGRRESLAAATDGGAYLRGMTLFIADLSTRLRKLTNYLPDLILTLIGNGMSENVKCSCMILKLCGEILEKNNKERFDQLIRKLETIVNNPETTTSVRNVIENVIQLRNNSWRTAPSVSNIPNPYLVNPEAEQYSDAWPYDFPNEIPTYDFGPCGDEDSEDVCTAFEEFLRNTGQL